MPYANEIVGTVVSMHASSSDTYVPDMTKDATELLRLICAGVEKSDDGVRVGMPEVIRTMRKLGYESLKKLTATFTVNGCTVPFTSETTGMQLYTLYKEEMARQSAEYKASPEGIAAQEERDRKVVENQKILDDEITALRGMVLAFAVQKRSGPKQPIGELAAKVFGSLARLIDAGDYKGVNYDRTVIQGILFELGYVGGEHVGCKEERRTLETWRAYIAGQIIDCLYPTSFNLLPPFAAFKIVELGLNTQTLIEGK